MLLGEKQWSLQDPGQDAYKAPWLSATSWNSTAQSGWDNILLAMLFSNGSIVVHWLDGPSNQWHMGFPSPRNVSALALHGDLRAYCVEGGQIKEYRIDKTKPATWSLSGNVTLPLVEEKEERSG